MPPTPDATIVAHQRYTPPPVHLGDSVVWAETASRLDNPAPAIVTKVGADAIGLIFFPPDSRVGTPRDGVRFHLDPANNRTMSDAGVWDFSEQTKALRVLVHDLSHRPQNHAEKHAGK